MGLDTRGKSDEETAKLVPEMIQELIKDLEIPITLSQVGVKADDIPTLARVAQQDLCMETNPYQYDAEEIESMYYEAL